MGIELIKNAFATARAEGRAAFMPYFPIGYPDYESSLAAIKALAESGADVIEIGVPFSDPLADGPTIQAATQIALQNGTTVAKCIQGVARLRQEGIVTPMVLMGYLNPFIAYGFDRLMDHVQQAQIDGFIVPDMPADEGDEFQQRITAAGLGIAHFVAPTSSAHRIQLAADLSRGFIYLVSVTGITGDKAALPAELTTLVERVRNVTDTPVAIGFGIRTPEIARAVGELCDGIFVGTALVKAAQEGTDAVRTLATELRQALNAQTV